MKDRNLYYMGKKMKAKDYSLLIKKMKTKDKRDWVMGIDVRVTLRKRKGSPRTEVSMRRDTKSHKNEIVMMR